MSSCAFCCIFVFVYLLLHQVLHYCTGGISSPAGWWSGSLEGTQWALNQRQCPPTCAISLHSKGGNCQKSALSLPPTQKCWKIFSMVCNSMERRSLLHRVLHAYRAVNLAIRSLHFTRLVHFVQISPLWKTVVLRGPQAISPPSVNINMCPDSTLLQARLSIIWHISQQIAPLMTWAMAHLRGIVMRVPLTL